MRCDKKDISKMSREEWLIAFGLMTEKKGLETRGWRKKVGVSSQVHTNLHNTLQLFQAIIVIMSGHKVDWSLKLQINVYFTLALL
jgi:hypothetical protein